MPKLADVSHFDAVRALEKAGFRIARQEKHITRLAQFCRGAAFARMLPALCVRGWQMLGPYAGQVLASRVPISCMLGLAFLRLQILT